MCIFWCTLNLIFMKFYNETQRRNRSPPLTEIRATYDKCFRKKMFHLIILRGWRHRRNSQCSNTLLVPWTLVPHIPKYRHCKQWNKIASLRVSCPFVRPSFRPTARLIPESEISVIFGIPLLPAWQIWFLFVLSLTQNIFHILLEYILSRLEKCIYSS